MIRGFFRNTFILLFLLFSSPHLTCQEPSIPSDFLEEEVQDQEHKLLDTKALLIKTLLLLGGLVGTLYGAAYFVKRMGGGRYATMTSEGAIRLIEKKHLSSRTSIWLVEVNNQPMVVIDSQNAVAVHAVNQPEKTEKQS